MFSFVNLFSFGFYVPIFFFSFTFFCVLNWVFDIWIVQKKTSDLSFLFLANTSMPTFRWADRYFACQLSFSMWVSLFLPSTLSHRISRYTNSKNESRQNVVLLPACYHMSAADASENTNRVHVNIWGIFIWNFHLHAPVYPPLHPPTPHPYSWDAPHFLCTPHFTLYFVWSALWNLDD